MDGGIICRNIQETLVSGLLMLKKLLKHNYVCGRKNQPTTCRAPSLPSTPLSFGFGLWPLFFLPKSPKTPPPPLEPLSSFTALASVGNVASLRAKSDQLPVSSSVTDIPPVGDLTCMPDELEMLLVYARWYEGSGGGAARCGALGARLLFEKFLFACDPACDPSCAGEDWYCACVTPLLVGAGCASLVLIACGCGSSLDGPAAES